MTAGRTGGMTLQTPREFRDRLRAQVQHNGWDEIVDDMLWERDAEIRREEREAAEALDTAMIVRHLGVFGPGDDAKATLGKILDWEVMVALDPAVSEAAQALIERGRAEERASAPAGKAAGEIRSMEFRHGEDDA